MIAIAASLAAGTACASAAKAAFKQPVVQLKDVKLVAFGMTGGTFDVVLNVFNPNEFRLDASKLSYEVLADSIIVGRGQIEDQRVVQANDSAQITLPINFTYTGLGAVAQQLRNSGLVNYRVRGAITVATTLGNFDVPCDQAGRFSLIGRDQE